VKDYNFCYDDVLPKVSNASSLSIEANNVDMLSKTVKNTELSWRRMLD